MKNKKVNITKIAIEASGGKRLVSESLSISLQAVEKWIKNEKISAGYVNQIISMTGGQYSLEQLRPDLHELYKNNFPAYVIDILIGSAVLCQALSVSRQAVSSWRRNGSIPDRRAHQIYNLLGGGFAIEKISGKK